MAEIPKQIKEFFEEKGIIPRDMEEELLGIKTEGTVGNGGRVNRRDFEINKRKKRAMRVQTENPVLMELKRKFVQDVAKIGFEKKDIELILRKKGLYALEKSLIVEQLSAMATIPELLDEKKKMEAEEARIKAIEEEKEKER